MTPNECKYTCKLDCFTAKWVPASLQIPPYIFDQHMFQHCTPHNLFVTFILSSLYLFFLFLFGTGVVIYWNGVINHGDYKPHSKYQDWHSKLLAVLVNYRLVRQQVRFVECLHHARISSSSPFICWCFLWPYLMFLLAFFDVLKMLLQVCPNW